MRKDLRRWLRDLHDRTGVTTIFVTHDQEEALDLADIVAVMNKGRIEQAASPRILFDQPETAFVAEFIGGAARFDGEVRGGTFQGGGLTARAGVTAGPASAFVRPHDWRIVGEGGLRATVLNVLDAGPTVRMDCRTDEGLLLEVVSPHEAEAVRRGATVRLHAETVRVFPR